LDQGARLAEPGEFTKRAFLNGRLDLAQAEGLLQVIRAKTGEGLKAALGQLEGTLSRRVQEIRREMILLLARLEAAIDFPEEGDVETWGAGKVKQKGRRLLEKVRELAGKGPPGQNIPGRGGNGHHRPAQRGEIFPLKRPAAGRKGHCYRSGRDHPGPTGRIC
jgi:tRNA modification GTPase